MRAQAFLLVWRIGLYNHHLRAKIADLAVMSFIQVAFIVAALGMEDAGSWTAC